VHLKEFSLVSPKIKSTEIFKAIEMAIPATAIEQAITKTKVEEKRHRALPAQLVVCLVIAMSLWSKDSMRDVLKNLIDGLNEGWIKIGKYWRFRVHLSFANRSSRKLTIKISTAKRKDRRNILDIPLCPR